MPIQMTMTCSIWIIKKFDRILVLHFKVGDLMMIYVLGENNSEVCMHIIYIAIYQEKSNPIEEK